MVLVIQPCMFRYNLLRTMHQQEELHKHVEIGFVNVNSKIDAGHAAVTECKGIFLLSAYQPACKDSVAADLKKITPLGHLRLAGRTQLVSGRLRYVVLS